MPVLILQRATTLTHLHCRCHLDGREHGLGAALAAMTGLRSLRLRITNDSREAFKLAPVLRALTNLTSLVYSGDFMPDTDIAACASLPALRSLEFRGIRVITPACLPALQAMTGLTALTLARTGIFCRDVTSGVRAAFNAERLCRGWPPLKLDVVSEG
jgi:hypothetical protein